MVLPHDRSPQPNRLSDHAVARYIERHGKRHVGGAPSLKWVAEHVADTAVWIWRVDFLGPLLLVNSTGLIRTVLP